MVVSNYVNNNFSLVIKIVYFVSFVEWSTTTTTKKTDQSHAKYWINDRMEQNLKMGTNVIIKKSNYYYYWAINYDIFDSQMVDDAFYLSSFSFVFEIWCAEIEWTFQTHSLTDNLESRFVAVLDHRFRSITNWNEWINWNRKRYANYPSLWLRINVCVVIGWHENFILSPMGINNRNV